MYQQQQTRAGNKNTSFLNYRYAWPFGDSSPSPSTTVTRVVAVAVGRGWRASERASERERACLPGGSSEKGGPVAHGGLGEARVEARVEEVLGHLPAVVAVRPERQRGLHASTRTAEANTRDQQAARLKNTNKGAWRAPRQTDVLDACVLLTKREERRRPGPVTRAAHTGSTVSKRTRPKPHVRR